jgi:ATP-binding cassette, subfamily C, type I secretion system permease/ATPase
VRKRKGIVIIIAHRPSAIAGVDQLLMMNQGKAQAIGPKDDVLSKVLERPRSLKIVPDTGSASVR